MILVDTSVLIDFLIGRNNSATGKLTAIIENHIPFGITAITFQEILQGARTKKEFSLLKRYLESQRFFHPTDPLATYAAAAEIFFRCRKKGVTLRSTIDCLIARIAIEHDLLLLHNDHDFDAIASTVKLKVYK